MDISSFSNASKELVVKNKMGIHARPAAMIVRAAKKYNNTEVWVEKGHEQVNGKSIMRLMMLAAGEGTKLVFMSRGPESAIILKEIEDLFEHRSHAA